MSEFHPVTADQLRRTASMVRSWLGHNTARPIEEAADKIAELEAQLQDKAAHGVWVTREQWKGMVDKLQWVEALGHEYELMHGTGVSATGVALKIKAALHPTGEIKRNKLSINPDNSGYKA